MTDVTHLELPEINILSRDFDEDPYKFFNEVRNDNWLAKTPAGFMVLGFDHIKNLLSMDEQFSTPNRMITQLMGAEGTPWGEWNDNFLLAQTGETHDRIRNLVSSTFTPRAANSQRTIMREEVTKLLDEWVPKGSFDFAEFASFFPITIMCRSIGAPTEPIPRIKHALEVQGAGFSLNPEILPDLNDSITFMWDYVNELVSERRNSAAKSEEERDLLDNLLIAADQENGLSEQELHYLLMLLFGGGYDTSKNLLTMIMHIMLDRPEMWEKLAGDIDYAKKVIDETLRYTNVVTTYRVAKEDVLYNDVVIPKDTTLIFPLPFSGRDPSVFADADGFDPERKAEQRHYAFGRGMHICLGQFLARAQIEEALPIIAARIPNARRDGDVVWRPFPGIWGLKSLPIRVDVQ